jgi:hypothetical protein
VTESFDSEASGGVEKLSTEKLSCGGGPVARHAQAEIRLSVEKSILRRKKFERNKLRRKSGEKYSKGGFL